MASLNTCISNPIEQNKKSRGRYGLNFTDSEKCF